MRTLALILAFGLFGCVTTDEPDHASDAMAFASAETGLPAIEIPPIERSEDLYDNAALYDFRENRVILAADWRPDREGLGALVHELTHALQYRHRRELFYEVDALEGCIALETEAYRVDYAYQKTVNAAEVHEILGMFTAEEASEIHARNHCRKAVS